jgi:tripartite-type tricarboxylate transporter receptor subunit TctC
MCRPWPKSDWTASWSAFGRASSRPAGTSATIINRLNAVINDGLKSAEMQASLAKLGAEPKPGSPQDFATFIATEAQKWTAVAKSAGVSVD